MPDDSSGQNDERTGEEQNVARLAGGDPSRWQRVTRPDPDESLGKKATLVGMLFFLAGGLAFVVAALAFVLLDVAGVFALLLSIFFLVLTMGMISPFDVGPFEFVVGFFVTQILPLFGAGGVLWAIGYGIVRAR